MPGRVRARWGVSGRGGAGPPGAPAGWMSQAGNFFASSSRVPDGSAGAMPGRTRSAPWPERRALSSDTPTAPARGTHRNRWERAARWTRPPPTRPEVASHLACPEVASHVTRPTSHAPPCRSGFASLVSGVPLRCSGNFFAVHPGGTAGACGDPDRARGWGGEAGSWAVRLLLKPPGRTRPLFSGGACFRAAWQGFGNGSFRGIGEAQSIVRESFETLSGDFRVGVGRGRGAGAGAWRRRGLRRSRGVAPTRGLAPPARRRTLGKTLVRGQSKPEGSRILDDPA